MAVQRETGTIYRLPGEPEAAHDREEARLWRSVYAELAAGFRAIAGLESEANSQELNDRVLTLEDRLTFWSRQHAWLSANHSRDAE